MPRGPRRAPAGWTFHVLNRAVARLRLFEKDDDYDAFLRVLAQAVPRYRVRLLAYCVMPNHWHFVLRPDKTGQLTDFVRWLTHTHTMRWHAHHHTAETGHFVSGAF